VDPSPFRVSDDTEFPISLLEYGYGNLEDGLGLSFGCQVPCRLRGTVSYLYRTIPVPVLHHIRIKSARVPYTNASSVPRPAT